MVEDQPDGANWRGTPGGDGVTYDTGYEYSYTFEVPGKYEYYCTPHKALNLGGTILVE
ncbi:plastocyanin/azurin family copper-binding protein [Haladaptatus salinisoli]|uniref:plastocyanin/azurin family copper-binding protein n=1 Tax=Haladaptatus salinisoli TaxID=2884876 RepID=UPI001D0A0998|nr:plastocyanin/azurin family copper-binding protein [Haladaptatus salinisoli]